MFTQEIRKSLDRYIILYIIMVELLKILDLQNCVVWMFNENRIEVILIYELKGRNLNLFNFSYGSVLYVDFDVRKIKESDEVKLIRFDLVFGIVSSGGLGDYGVVVVIRMSMFKVFNFKGGIFELM